MNPYAPIMPTGLLDLTMLVLNTAAGLIVLWTAICTLNFMNTGTPWHSRIAYVLIGVGAGGMLLAPFYWQHMPGFSGPIVMVGLAIHLVTERLYTRKLAARYASRLSRPKQN